MNFASSITLAFKDAFSSGFKDAQASLAGMKSALDEINQNQEMNRLAADMAMMTGMTEPMRKALSDAMDKPSQIAGSLDSAFRNIQVASGNTNEEMAVLRRELLAIGGRSVAGPQAIASAFSDIAGGVDDASKRMAIMNASVQLAEANQADLGVATNAMINVMNAWSLSADDAAIAADVLTHASYAGVGSLDEFSSAIGHISTLAAGAGIGLDELGASLAFATTKGMSATQAQKQFKGIISTLASPSENLSKLYSALGIESGQAMLQEYGLAESLSILKNALGGNEQAFAEIIGSTEAATIALALTEDQYIDFAGSFADAMGSVTESAQGIQLESIEMKMARLQSASDSLQARIGADINGIKGFFIDMKFGFLSNVVTPLMNSPVGGAISKIASVTGMAAKTMLDMGSGALNAAAQMTTLAANISNAGGIAKLFQSGIGMIGGGLKILSAPLQVIGKGIMSMGASIIGALPAIGGYIASMWASVTATLAATWPILAIIAGVAALAAGVYLIIKNWDKVSAFFCNLWDGVKAVFTNVWNAIKNFFSAIWDGIKSIVQKYINWYMGLWDGVKAAFSAVWNAVKDFFAGIWNGIKNIVMGYANWSRGLWEGVVNGFKAVWGSVKDFFVGLWEGIKGIVMGFVDWIGGIVEKIIAPFKAAGDFIGGIFSKVGGAVSSLFGGGKESGSRLNDAFAGGIQSNASAPAAAFGTSLQGVARQMPHSDAPEGPLSQLTASGRALTDTFASGMDEDTLQDKASLVFSAAMPQDEAAAFPAATETIPQKTGGSQTIHIENLYLQADDCQIVFDFIRMLMQAGSRPVEAAV